MAAFASASDVAIRLGRNLTAAETAMVDALIEGVTGMIAVAAGKDDAWATALSPVPSYLKWLTIEKALAVGSNPNQLRSLTEQLGSSTRTKVFSDASIFLTDDEERRIRQVVFGSDSGSVRVPSLVTDWYDLVYPNGS